MRRPRVVPPIDTEPDHVLAQRAAEGDSRSFEELYRRHAPAAWRVAYAVAGNPDDAADAVSDAFTRVFQVLPEGRPQASEAFRPYLLAATRNAALDGLRRQGRLQPTGTVDQFDHASDEDLAADQVLDSVDSNLVAIAFRSLPERWRSVLWLTEVEGIPAREAAPLLGVSANGLAQLAVRARAGLRQRFLQAHLRAPVARSCQFPVDKLGAYIAGGLSPRETAKVDQHLAGCADCRQQVEELEDLGSMLRRIILPVPLALGAVSLSKWKLSTKLASSVRRSPALWQARKPVAAVAAVMFALGVITATVLNRDLEGAGPPTAAGRRDNGSEQNQVILEQAPDRRGAASATASRNAGFEQGDSTTVTGGTTGSGGGGTPGGNAGGGGGNGTPNPNPGGGDGTPPPPGTTEVLAGVYAPPLGTALAIGSCTGVTLLDAATLGCEPEKGEGIAQLQLGANKIGL